MLSNKCSDCSSANVCSTVYPPVMLNVHENTPMNTLNVVKQNRVFNNMLSVVKRSIPFNSMIHCSTFVQNSTRAQHFTPHLLRSKC